MRQTASDPGGAAFLLVRSRAEPEVPADRYCLVLLFGLRLLAQWPQPGQGVAPGCQSKLGAHESAEWVLAMRGDHRAQQLPRIVAQNVDHAARPRLANRSIAEVPVANSHPGVIQLDRRRIWSQLLHPQFALRELRIEA